MSVEQLCWEIASKSDEDGDVTDLKPAPSDEILQAYKAGQLSTDEEVRLELWLARSRSARQRLAALSEVALAAPPVELRQRVLSQPSRPRRAGPFASVAADRMAPAMESLLVKP